MQQMYDWLDISYHGASYLYQSLESGFTAELSVDSDGLVRIIRNCLEGYYNRTDKNKALALYLYQ